MRTKKELQKVLSEARKELDIIVSAEELKKNTALVGKCFKYRNNYSCPESEADYWWMYEKVVSGDENGIKLWQFQTDKYGDISIEWAKHGYVHSESHNEISSEEFYAAWAQLRLRIVAAS